MQARGQASSQQILAPRTGQLRRDTERGRRCVLQHAQIEDLECGNHFMALVCKIIMQPVLNLAAKGHSLTAGQDGDLQTTSG